MKDYYNILGVARNATADDIKRAYRKLASQHHPDKGGDTNRFQEIEEAYRILSDDQKRQAYDNPQQNFGFNFQSNGPFDFDSIFDIFGARFNQPRHSAVRMSLTIGLADVAMGGHRTISVGTHQGTQTVEIEIPQGIDDGVNVQYQGVAPGGGDLIVTFRVQPHPQWERRGSTLLTNRTVSIWDLILGGETTITDILGNQFNLTVPPKTQPGTILRMKGRGLPQRGGGYGDILVRMQAQIPNHIEPEILEAIERNRH